MESFLTTVSNLIREKQLPALMIGGHAVTALGHPRATYDLDLLIPQISAPAWSSALTELGFRSYAETANFIQFEADASLPLPPVDLMLVDDDVFESLASTKNDSSPIPTPAVQAMIALKLHAINQPARENTAQNWADVFALIKANNLSLDDPDFPLSSQNMEEQPQPNESARKSLVEIDLPTGEAPKPHAPRFLDPRIVEAHFAPLMKNPPSAEERWARKANATPFVW